MSKDPLRQFPGYALRRASNSSLALLTPRLGELDLKLTEASMLVVMGANPKITQSELGRILGVASANVAPLVAKLHDRGLVSRTPVDGRSHSLELTEAGQALSDKALDTMKDHEAKILEKIPVELQGCFVEAVNRIWEDS